MSHLSLVMPIGTPISLSFIASALAFLPSILGF